MKENFRRNLSASSLQQSINQFFSLLVFYFLSTSLTKEEFGELNWTLSIFLVAFTVLTCGIDQIIVKKIAEGEDKNKLVSVHLFHVFVTGIATFIFLLLTSRLVASPGYRNLLLIIGLGKMFLFFSTPFKAVSSGAENFRYVFFMSITSTLTKCCCLSYLLFTNKLTLLNTAFIFLIADASEFIIGGYVVRKKMGVPIHLHFNFKNYSQILKVAIPQIGVVLFSSTLARIDWLLVGIFLASSKVAEYSFAYKGFELASLPLLAIAPLLLPAFSRILVQQKKIEEQQSVQLLFRAEMAIACLTSLCMNILWSPVVDGITDGKYGAVNSLPVFYLSATLPILYLNNFLWSIHFSNGRFRYIFYSFALCFTVNLLGNLVLIPLLQTSGAALSYLISLSVQCWFYAKRTCKQLTFDWRPFFVCSICALAAGTVCKLLPFASWQIFPIGVGFYLLLLLFTVQIRKADFRNLKQAMSS